MTPELPWQGRWVRVLEDGSWVWTRCVMCSQPLRDEASRERGYGPICAEQYEMEQFDLRKAKARAEDRQLWARNRQWERAYGEPSVRHARAIRDAGGPDLRMRERRARSGGRLASALARADADEDAARRWKAFQEARKRDNPGASPD